MRVPVSDSCFFVTLASSGTNWSEFSFYEPTMFLAIERLVRYVRDGRDSTYAFTIDFAEPPVHQKMEERRSRRVEGLIAPQGREAVGRFVKLACVKNRPTIEKFFRSFSDPSFIPDSFLSPRG